MSWLNDHESDVFVACTSNDITKLTPEFSLAERFDTIFFVDLPSREQKDAIWAMYREVFNIDSEQACQRMINGPEPQFDRVAVWPRYSMFHYFKRLKTLYRWLSHRLNR